MATFPLTPLLDDFNRADGGLGGNWVSPAFGVLGTFTIVSNQAVPSASAYMAWVRSFGPDQECYVDVPTLPASGQDVLLSARRVSTGTPAPDGYEAKVTWSTSQVQIRKSVTQVNTTLLTISAVTFGAGDSFGFRADGTLLTAFQKTGGVWAELGSIADSTFLGGGFLGARSSDAVTRLDNFGGGALSRNPAPTHIPFMR